MSLFSKLFGRPSAMPVGRSLIEYERQAPAHWQQALDAQHTPGTARLYIAWEPGDRWQVIHRWFLWQLQPWQYVDETFRSELRGPHPRSTGHYCAAGHCLCAKPINKWRGGACSLIDRRTWEIHREVERTTGELVRPRRLWVLQGDNGGHPFTITQAEKKWRSAAGLPEDVPSAGDLPYTEFDRRVLVALERYDLWRFARGIGDPMTNAARLTIAAMSDREVEAHKLMWQNLVTLGEEFASGAAHAARQDGYHRLRMTPVGQKARAVDIDRARDSYINDPSIEAA